MGTDINNLTISEMENILRAFNIGNIDNILFCNDTEYKKQLQFLIDMELTTEDILIYINDEIENNPYTIFS